MRYRLVLFFVFCLCACAPYKELPAPQEAETTTMDSWGRVITKSSLVGLDSLEAVRQAQTSEMVLLTSMISRKDGVYELTLSSDELDSLGVSSASVESVMTYLRTLNGE